MKWLKLPTIAEDLFPEREERSMPIKSDIFDDPPARQDEGEPTMPYFHEGGYFYHDPYPSATPDLSLEMQRDDREGTNRLSVPEISCYSREEIEGGVVIRYMIRQPGETTWQPVKAFRPTASPATNEPNN